MITTDLVKHKSKCSQNGNLKGEKSIKIDRLIDLETQRRERRRERKNRREGKEDKRRGDNRLSYSPKYK